MQAARSAFRVELRADNWKLVERRHKTMAQIRGADESENGDHHEQQRIDRHKSVPAKSYNQLIDSVISRFPDNSIDQSKWTGLSLPSVDYDEKTLNALQHDLLPLDTTATRRRMD